MNLPDRLSALSVRIENGETVTQADVNRVATLQAFDLVQMGRQFVEEAVSRSEDVDNDYIK